MQGDPVALAFSGPLRAVHQARPLWYSRHSPIHRAYNSGRSQPTVLATTARRDAARSPWHSENVHFAAYAPDARSSPTAAQSCSHLSATILLATQCSAQRHTRPPTALWAFG